MTETRRWQAPPYSYAEAHALAGELGLSVTTASILARRGLGEAAAARRFLAASASHDPFAFDGMAETVELVLGHVRRGSTIAVFGDYDVDGVCSTALAVESLRGLGATVHPRLPSRTEDGYGLTERAVRELRAQGADLLLTADCGIGAVDEVALARSLGMDVVVTDHHRPGEGLPDCPLVHPVVCRYPNPDLCATGVVYKLCQALAAGAGRDPGSHADQLDLVALATVADLVPLRGENRTLVRAGLRALAGTARPGLRALMKVAGTEPQSIDEHKIGFVLAPRINAAGRLYRADAALELLMTADAGRALEIARELEAINAERRSVETRILFEAENQLSSAAARRSDPLHVLAGEEWHPGVIGIVASRLVERHHRPFVLVALDGEGAGRGSGRSITAYDLHAGLSACAQHLTRFGGHRMAAGLELDAGDLEAFRDDLVEHARARLTEDDLVAVDRIDAVVAGDAVGLDLAEELEQLRPFGVGNPGVNLLVPAARVSDVRPMGEGRHARLTVSAGGVRSRAVVFGSGDRVVAKQQSEHRHDLVARLEANEWGGAVEPRLVLRALHPLPATGSEDAAASAAAGCSRCECLAGGDAWWAHVRRELHRDEPAPGVAHDVPHRDGDRAVALDGGKAARVDGAPRVLVDSRDRGALGCLSDLLSTDEPVAVVCADVSRRRALLDHELAPDRFGRPEALVVSERCAGRMIDERLAAVGERALCLADHATIAERPGALDRFTHVFALDPPSSERSAALLSHSPASSPGTAPGAAAPAFLHLGWGAAELEFARRALEQEYSLRAPLTAIYRALRGGPEGLEGTALEAALKGDGRHPRSPALAGRCLRVLRELGLVAIEHSSATVRCTIIGEGKANLEHSEAFRRYTRTYEEGLRYLSGPAQPMRRASAA